MNVLVVFELISEKTSFFIIDMTDEEYELYSKADNYIVNVSEWDDEKVDIVNLFSNAICNNPENIKYCNNEKERSVFGKWSDKRVDSIKTLKGVERGISLAFHL